MRVVFMGTPAFAVGALEALIREGYDIAAVVTQPDKPRGRGKEMQYMPVKKCALEAGITVFQPVKIKTAEAVEVLRSYNADIFIVAAFGQILSREILDMPRLGCINIHASLLPKYRGAAPIQWAIINGEKESGITIMQMDAGLDTGDMLLKKVVPISPDDTGESLHDKLMAAGAQLIVEALPKIEKGEIIGEKQKDCESTYAGMLKKSLGQIDWSKPAAETERLIRGLNSWPSAYTMYHGRVLKIWEASVINGESEEIPGTVVAVEKDGLKVVSGKELLLIKTVQLEGKKSMTVHDFLLGNPMEAGCILG